MMALNTLMINPTGTPTLLVMLTLLGYAAASFLLRRGQLQSARGPAFTAILALSVALHLLAAHQLLRSSEGLDLSLPKVLALIDRKSVV